MPQPALSKSSMPARFQSEDARQYTYRIIRSCILELRLFPGQKMNEADLASTLDTSRTPVHDTLIKLSRENLVDIVPQRGAFVSRIDCRRIEQAVWLHTSLGIFALQTIFIRNVRKNQMDDLYYCLHQMDESLYSGNLVQASRLVCSYYHQLYILAGNMELIWDSLMKVDVDLYRILYLATSSCAVVEGFLCELTDLTEALAHRDNGKACQIYAHHLSRILMLLPHLRQHNPEYFICDTEDAAS